MTTDTEINSPAIGSALRGYIRDRMKEVDGWQALDGFLKQVSDIEGHLANKRNEVARLEGEAVTARDQVKAFRMEGEQIVSDAAAEAERIKQQATEIMDDAEAVKAEADDVLAQARETARKIVRDAEAQVARALSGLKG